LIDSDDIPMSHRVAFGHQIAESCRDLAQVGYRCYLGRHQQILTPGPASSLTFQVGLVTFQSASERPREYAFVQIEGAWDVHPEGRVPLQLREGIEQAH
jgi:hypothetical protein